MSRTVMLPSPAPQLRRTLGRPPRAVHGGLLLVVEVAQETLRLAEALDVERVEVDAVPAAGGPSGSPAPQLAPVAQAALAASARKPDKGRTTLEDGVPMRR